MNKYTLFFYNHKKKNNQAFSMKIESENLKSARKRAKEIKEYGGWDYVMINEPLKEVTGLYCSSLQYLIDTLKSADITDFSKVEFDLDYSSCYYESDTPGIMARIKE